jgi:exopolyphosphatase/guanosine-5'-triphosphate,3'-diphosphate pyrophosphatase
VIVDPSAVDGERLGEPPGVAGDAIVPRWEWRTFGGHFDGADARFDALEPEQVQESDEIYILSSRGGGTVKVRAGLMDVKRLEHVDRNGLEQWKPTLKASFPLAAADLAYVLETLGVAVPSEREAYALDELLAEVVRPSSELRSVEVHKRRNRYMLNGCSAERTEVVADGRTTKTIAVEHPDAALVFATVSELGLAARRNTSYPNGLAALIGFAGSRYAVIDVGTNSVKLHIGERRPEGAWATVDDRAEVTQLGEGLGDDRMLQPAPIERTASAIEAMVIEARSAGAEEIAAVGTAGLRAAANSSQLVEEVERRTGVAVEVISGEEEARLAFLAARSGLGLSHGAIAVFDTGGGSSQFTFGSGDEIDEQFSVPVGAVRFTEEFGLDGAVSEESLAAARAAIAGELARLDGRTAPDALVAMGGAITNMAAVKLALPDYDPDVVQGTVLERSEVERQIERYRAVPADERRAVVGLQPKRAEVILAGACIVGAVLDKLGCDSLTVSDRGLRHGVLVERFGT